MLPSSNAPKTENQPHPSRDDDKPFTQVPYPSPQPHQPQTTESSLHDVTYHKHKTLTTIETQQMIDDTTSGFKNLRVSGIKGLSDLSRVPRPRFRSSHLVTIEKAKTHAQKVGDEKYPLGLRTQYEKIVDYANQNLNRHTQVQLMKIDIELTKTRIKIMKARLQLHQAKMRRIRNSN
ncbi:hypothetical protein BGW42_003749 [Actinomortierella wolfii]|nr:hypothetical protein BGW42_003749 [Actinomortierella wolfii]